MKKLTAVLTASAMVVGLAACGGGNTAQTTAAATGNSADTTAAAEDTSAAEASSTAGAADGADYSSLAPVELVGADASSKGAAAQMLGELVAEKVDAITGGQLTIDYHPNSELGGDAECASSVSE